MADWLIIHLKRIIACTAFVNYLNYENYRLSVQLVLKNTHLAKFMRIRCPTRLSVQNYLEWMVVEKFGSS